MILSNNKLVNSFFALILLSSTFLSPVFADTVELNSGKKLYGKVFSITEETVKLDSDTERLYIDRKKVKNVIFDGQHSCIIIPKKPAVNESSPKNTSNSTKNKKKKGSKVVKTSKEKEKKKVSSYKPPLKPKIKANQPKKNSAKLCGKPETIDYVTYITGSKSNKPYLGLYTNDKIDENIVIYLPKKKSKKLDFHLHSQKNGNLPVVNASVAVLFLDKSGKMINITSPITEDQGGFIEWFRNLEAIAGVTGQRQLSLKIPKDAFAAVLKGVRKDENGTIMGYVSNIMVDNIPITKLNIDR